MVNAKIVPEGWKLELQRTLDFDRAYVALQACDHPEACFWRGVIRIVQSRPEEALTHFEIAEQAYSGPDSAESRWFWAQLLGLRITALRLLQIDSDEAGSSTIDVTLGRLLAIDPDGRPAISRVQEKYRGFDFLARGAYAESLDVFEEIVERNRREPERSTAAYIGAAAAAHQLGQYKKSRRHYENAELCMAFSQDRVAFSLFLAWLVALCSRWGWEGELMRWQETIRVLECPERTRRYISVYAEQLSVQLSQSAGIVLV